MMVPLILLTLLGLASPVRADAVPAPPAAPAVGIVTDPCAGVPIAPTAAHQATSDPYQSAATHHRSAENSSAFAIRWKAASPR